MIEDQVAFTSAVSKAVALAEEGKLVTFGVVPRMPHTGYGYIKGDPWARALLLRPSGEA